MCLDSEQNGLVLLHPRHHGDQLNGIPLFGHPCPEAVPVSADLGPSGQWEMPGDTWAWPEHRVLLASDGQRPLTAAVNGDAVNGLRRAPQPRTARRPGPSVAGVRSSIPGWKSRFSPNDCVPASGTGAGQGEDDAVPGVQRPGSGEAS